MDHVPPGVQSQIDRAGQYDLDIKIRTSSTGEIWLDVTVRCLKLAYRTEIKTSPQVTLSHSAASLMAGHAGRSDDRLAIRLDILRLSRCSGIPTCEAKVATTRAQSGQTVASLG